MKLDQIALIGNPNSGKSSLFNALTGLNQKVGNYPGVTLEKKQGYFSHLGNSFEIIDFPGLYSLYPNSKDEERLFELLTQGEIKKIIFLADASNFRRSLLLYEQLQDLQIPILFVLNLVDEANKKGIFINIENLSKGLSREVVVINARKAKGIQKLKDHLGGFAKSKNFRFDPENYFKEWMPFLKNQLSLDNTYKAWVHLITKGNKASSNFDTDLVEILNKHKLIPKRLQVKETIERYKQIDQLLEGVVEKKEGIYKNVSQKIDAYLLHPFWGYFIFFALLFFCFQALYTWAEGPKVLIENIFSFFSLKLELISSTSPLVSLLSKGILPGLSSVFSFIPQIGLLFFFLSVIEESGYINRVIFLMDRLMRPFGLSGKSLISLLSGAACSIPAIISTRNIENPRNRLITLLVIPFVTCSARLPIYILIIGLVIPNYIWGIFNLQGFVLMIMYLIGTFLALFGAFVLNKVLKKSYKDDLILDIPSYKWPRLKDIFILLLSKIKSFAFGAGKIIVAISILIWGLGSNSPSDFKNFNEKSAFQKKTQLEDSFLGIMGKSMEPLVAPLGYDWKISIGLLSSFVAREVFVSTMASLYNLDSSTPSDLKKNMSKEIRKKDGKPLYSMATGFSLLMFYALSMQCLSTLAVVRQETNSWKWPIIQFIFMGVMAYVMSFLTYQILK